MPRIGQKQVLFGSPQPSFPDGWGLALFNALGSFDAAAAARHKPPISTRSASRLRNGASPEQATRDLWESKLTGLVTEFFPHVAGINGFAAKYVQEYFNAWNTSAAAAPVFVEVAGAVPAPNKVLARALVRDLLLRLCYLETCERRLTGCAEVVFFELHAPEAIYRSLIDARKPANGYDEEHLAKELKVSSRTIRRWLSSDAVPTRNNLHALAPKGDQRLLSGIGFFDSLLRRLSLREGPLTGELMQMAGQILRLHAHSLAVFRDFVNDGNGDKPCGFDEFALFKENLLLHPGFTDLHGRLPDALWRVHVHVLQCGKFFDLAKVYLRFATPDNEQGLRDFLGKAERRGDGDPLRLPP